MEANDNSHVFESQCPKIMVLSKALKAKLSSIPSEVASLSTLGLEWSRKPPSLGLHSTTCNGDTLGCSGPIEGLFSIGWCARCGSHGSSGALSLSLSVKEDRSTFGGVVGILAKI